MSDNEMILRFRVSVQIAAPQSSSRGGASAEYERVGDATGIPSVMEVNREDRTARWWVYCSSSAWEAEILNFPAFFQLFVRSACG